MKLCWRHFLGNLSQACLEEMSVVNRRWLKRMWAFLNTYCCHVLCFVLLLFRIQFSTSAFTVIKYFPPRPGSSRTAVFSLSSVCGTSCPQWSDSFLHWDRAVGGWVVFQSVAIPKFVWQHHLKVSINLRVLCVRCLILQIVFWVLVIGILLNFQIGSLLFICHSICTNFTFSLYRLKALCWRGNNTCPI